MLHLVPSTNHSPRAWTAVSQLLLQVANKFRALFYNLSGLRVEGSSLLCGNHTASPSRLSIVLLAPFLSPKIKSVLGTPTLFLPKPLRYLPLHGLGLVIGSGAWLGRLTQFSLDSCSLSQDQPSLPGADHIQT